MNATHPDQHRRRLTVALVVRNDGPRLADTLQSVEHIADEIVVVDTGSSDNTREIARQLGARLVEFEWCDDFSAARNCALANASGDWVLWLDSGETLRPDDAAGLRASMDLGLDASKAYMMIVKPPVAPGTIAPEQIARIRLMPRREGVRYQGRVRESLFESLELHGIGLEGLPWRIHRPSRDHEVEVKVARAKRNRRLAQIESNETGQSAALLNCLADAAQTLGETKQAIALYRECLAAQSTASSEQLEAYYGLLTCLDSAENARQVQLSLCVEALEQFPLDAQLLCAMGGYLQGQQRIDLAARSYQTAYEFGRVNPLVWHMDEITSIAAVCWSLALQLQDDDDRALEVLNDAAVREGNNARITRAMLELHIKHGRRDAAQQLVQHLDIDDQQQNPLQLAIAGACLASAQNWAEAKPVLVKAYQAGCCDATCLRWLTVVHAALGEAEAAQAVLCRWRESNPADPEPIRLQLLLLPVESSKAAPSKQIRIDTPVVAGGSPAHVEAGGSPASIEYH